MTASDFCMYVIACDLYDGRVYWDQKGPKKWTKIDQKEGDYFYYQHQNNS